MKKLFFIIFLFPIFLNGCQVQKEDDFRFGADELLSDYFYLIKNKQLGIVTNHTAVLSNGVHLVDTLNSLKEVKIVSLFGPEHGIRGDNSAGKNIDNETDEKTGLPVYSLYGTNRKPTKEMLKNIDVMIFDIQDVGARFYTYISTLFYVIQSAAENRIPIIVLDRPNPINGDYVDGPIRKPDLNSFVGIAPLPITHGMTIGELAQYFAGEKLIGENLHVDLQVVKLKNWDRKLYYDEYVTSWINPSPNIQSINTAIVYPGTCLLEGTNISEGRGTDSPFLKIGAPFIKSDELISELMQQKIDGIKLQPISFTPVSIPGVANNPKHENENCNGVKIIVDNRNKFESVKLGIQLISTIYRMYPNEFQFRDASFDRLAGDKLIREEIIDEISADKIIELYQNELQEFKEIRKKYLLY